MSTSTTVDVSHLANLSSLTVSDGLAVKLATQFLDTLKVVKQLEELNTQNVTPTSQVTNKVNHFRSDEVDFQRLLSQAEAISNAKKTYKGFFVVPAVL
jgi:aspartyl/glutamyl-tRNA(Asn/Gln) amidotransferase C subunit